MKIIDECLFIWKTSGIPALNSLISDCEVCKVVKNWQYFLPESEDPFNL